MNTDEAKAVQSLRSGQMLMVCPECSSNTAVIDNRPFGSGKVYHLHCGACKHDTASETGMAPLVSKYGRMKGLPDGKGLLLSSGKIPEDAPIAQAGTSSFIADDDLDPHAPPKRRDAPKQETVMVAVGKSVAVEPQKAPAMPVPPIVEAKVVARSEPVKEPVEEDPFLNRPLPPFKWHDSGERIQSFTLENGNLLALTSEGRLLFRRLAADEPLDSEWFVLPGPPPPAERDLR